MIKLTDHVEEIKKMIRNTTPEELTVFMRERGYDFTFEDPNKEDEPMTTLDLTHLETLLAAATPGPWEADHNCTTFLYSTEYEIGRIESGQDADLIIALRNAAPALIARIREQEEIMEQAKGVFTEIDDVTDELDKANARVRELENSQIATVVDTDTGFTINGPEWNALPLKARLIIQELSLQNDVLNEELSFASEDWEPIETAPRENEIRILVLSDEGEIFTANWDDIFKGWYVIGDYATDIFTHWKPLPA